MESGWRILFPMEDRQPLSISLGYLVVSRVPKAAEVGSPFWTRAFRQNPF
jgi:hypothetical protein